METSKSEIFDDLIANEDRMYDEVRIRLKDLMYTKYGQVGLSVAENYFNQVDGVETTDTEDEVEEECDECRERAKRMTDLLDFIHSATAIFSDDEKNALSERYYNNGDVKRMLSAIRVFLHEKTDSDVSKDEVVCGVLLNYCKELLKNDNRIQREL